MSYNRQRRNNSIQCSNSVIKREAIEAFEIFFFVQTVGDIAGSCGSAKAGKAGIRLVVPAAAQVGVDAKFHGRKRVVEDVIAHEKAY